MLGPNESLRYKSRPLDTDSTYLPESARPNERSEVIDYDSLLLDNHAAPPFNEGVRVLRKDFQA